MYNNLINSPSTELLYFSDCINSHSEFEFKILLNRDKFVKYNI